MYFLFKVKDLNDDLIIKVVYFLLRSERTNGLIVEPVVLCTQGTMGENRRPMLEKELQRKSKLAKRNVAPMRQTIKKRTTE